MKIQTLVSKHIIFIAGRNVPADYADNFSWKNLRDLRNQITDCTESAMSSIVVKWAPRDLRDIYAIPYKNIFRSPSEI